MISWCTRLRNCKSSRCINYMGECPEGRTEGLVEESLYDLSESPNQDKFNYVQILYTSSTEAVHESML